MTFFMSQPTVTRCSKSCLKFVPAIERSQEEYVWRLQMRREKRMCLPGVVLVGVLKIQADRGPRLVD